MSEANVEELRALLLGRLSAPERDRLEESLLRDEELFELSLALEEELIDELVRGVLAETDARAFTEYLDCLPDGRSRAQVSRALQARALQARPMSRSGDGPAESTSTSWWRRKGLSSTSLRALYTAAIVLFALGVTLSEYKNARLAKAVHELEEELGRSRARNRVLEGERGRLGSPTHPPGQPPQATPPVTSSATASEAQRVLRSRAVAVLTAGALRGGRSRLPVVEVTNQEVIDLELDLGSHEYATYRAALCDADGREIASASQLEAESSDDRILVTFSILADWLRTGDYLIALEGVTPSGQREPIHRYSFRARVKSLPRNP